MGRGGVIIGIQPWFLKFFSLFLLYFFFLLQTKAIITVPLLSDDGSGRSYPRIFNVSLFSPSGGAVLRAQYRNARVFISNSQITARYLQLRSDFLSSDLNDVKIESMLRRMADTVSATLSDDALLIIFTTISDILNFKDQSDPGSRALTSLSRDYLLSTLNSLASMDREDTAGKASWAKLLEKALFTLTNDWDCPTRAVYTQGNFEVTLRRDVKSKLNGASFLSGSSSFTYPLNLFSSSETLCTDIQFVNMKNTQWFSGSSGVLSNKVSAHVFREIFKWSYFFNICMSYFRAWSEKIQCLLRLFVACEVKCSWL